jgi:type II secretory pathway component PulF
MSSVIAPTFGTSGSRGGRAPDGTARFTATADAIGASLSTHLEQEETTRRRSVRKQEVAEFTSQLAIMARSGVDIASALSSLASQCQRPALAGVLRNVREMVLGGSSLSEALKRHPAVFEPTFVATVAAGEASGRMAEVLQQLAEMQRRELRSARALRGLMTYPVLLLSVSGSVLVALVLFVLPRFTEIFAQYDMPLPVITQLLIALAGELRTRWWLWAPLAFGIVAGGIIWRMSENGRQRLDRLWIRGPLVGDIYRRVMVGRTCQLLGLMLDNGVPLVESLQLTRQAIHNSLYRQLLSELEEAVINGQGLSSALRTADIIPESAREMIVTAENTGKLDEVLRMIGDYYEEEAEAKTRQVIGLLEPIITVVMGAVVAAVVLAVMLPVFDLSTFASGGG